MIRAVIGAIVFLSSPPVTAPLAEPPWTIIALPSGSRFHAEIFDTPELQAQGLMFRDPIASDAAALFVFEKSGRYGFWTKNCTFAMDIVWLDAKKRVVDMRAAVPPCPGLECPVYTPRADSRYVVEFLAGTVERQRIVRGTTFRFDLHAMPTQSPTANDAPGIRTLPTATGPP